MDFRDILLVLHIAGAGTWLGANVVQAVAPGMAARQGQAVLAGWYRMAASFNRLYIPAASLILVTGFLLVAQTDAYGYADPFVLIGMAMIVIGAVLGMVVFDPVGNRAARAIDDADEAGTRSAVSRLTLFGVVDTVLLLFTITVMVLRLGA